VAVVSWSFWQGPLGAAPDVVGSDLLLDGRRRTVIGVMPAGFAYPDADIAVFTPLLADPVQAARGSRFLFAPEPEFYLSLGPMPQSRLFLAVVGLLTCVALAACWLPARRATRLDPMRVLRSD
jgi:ABC-type antimicrobial peptide transport system permease subunit